MTRSVPDPFFNDYSFNPCFNGFVVMTETRVNTDACVTGFNPCFNGFVVMTMRVVGFMSTYTVSILVLMDSLL